MINPGAADNPLLVAKMVDSAAEWLAREVADLLEAGSVGVHELIWLLNGSEFDLADTTKVARTRGPRRAVSRCEHRR